MLTLLQEKRTVLMEFLERLWEIDPNSEMKEAEACVMNKLDRLEKQIRELSDSRK